MTEPAGESMTAGRLGSPGMSEDVTRQERYDRLVDRLEIPMLALSLLLIPIVLMPFTEDLSETSLRALEWLGIVIWACFVVEYAVLLAIAPDRWHMVRTHKLDLLMVLLPVLRPARLIRLARAGTALARAIRAFRRLLGRPGFGTIIGSVTGLIVVGGGLVTIAEHDQPGSTIAGPADGLWWAFVTCTTVGYGDEFPVTESGRVIAVVLMLAGISGLSAITANVAAYFVQTDVEEEPSPDAKQLDRIERQLADLNARLAAAEAGREAGG